MSRGNSQHVPGQSGLFDALFEQPEPDPIWGDRWLNKDRTEVNQKPYGRKEQPIITAESVVFDWQQAKQEMHEAIDRADNNASPTWKQAFWDALVHVATSEQSFTADHVWQKLAELPHIPHTSDNRAAGGIFTRAHNKGLIRMRDKSEPNAFEESKRKHCHRMLIRVYDSLVYGKQPHEIPAYA